MFFHRPSGEAGARACGKTEADANLDKLKKGSKNMWQYDLPINVHRAVCALVGDYNRRERIISERTAPDDVLQNAVFMNAHIYNAVNDICDVALRSIMIYDIGNNIGYSKSRAATMIGEVAYKKQKRRVKYEIARRLNLI